MIRHQSGMTVMELVVSSILMGCCFAAIGELVVLNTFASTKLTNKIDGQVGCSRAMRRVCEDIRQARCVGNVYSTSARNNYPDTSSTSTDPFGIPPVLGFPAPPWPVTPYVLSPQTLIIQQPVFYQDTASTSNPLNGFPVRLEAGSVSTSPSLPKVAMEYVDTVVYQLIPDPDEQAKGQYVLQIARFSGFPIISNCKLRPAINPPQTVLKGIVGPIDPANPAAPSVFQYLSSAQETAPIATPDSQQTASIAGVSINFEVKMPNSNSGTNQEIASAHAEAFLRSGRFMRLTND